MAIPAAAHLVEDPLRAAFRPVLATIQNQMDRAPSPRLRRALLRLADAALKEEQQEQRAQEGGA